MCFKTPPEHEELGEGGKQSKNVIERAQDLYHKYIKVSDKDAPRGVGCDRRDIKSPLEQDGYYLNTQEAAKREAEEGTYYTLQMN